MIFHSYDYLFFIVAFIPTYWFLPQRGQNLLLVVASYFFYGYAEPWFVSLLLLSTTVDYWLAQRIENARTARRRSYLIVSIALNLGLLGVFKYGDFGLRNLNAVFDALGLGEPLPLLKLMLPAGISFYTFQSIGYIVDVYRRKTNACRSLVDYAGFVAFFPQLVAGPIERSQDLLSQLTKNRSIDGTQVTQGLLLIAWGYVQKLIVADNVAMVANQVFSLHQVDFWTLWIGVFAFGLQIYADFSAYSDIARGTAKLLGIELTRNFIHPYASLSPAEFWRRWHVTLGRWFKDYVFKPIVGDASSRSRRSFAYAAVFLLSGLWHGASWNFVLWGAYHGALLILCFLLAPVVPSLWRTSAMTAPLRWAMTFVAMNVGWLFFREHDMGRLVDALTTSPFGDSVVPSGTKLYFLGILAASWIPMLVAAYAEAVGKAFAPQGELGRWREPVRFAIAVLLFVLVFLAGTADPTDFIYFQF